MLKDNITHAVYLKFVFFHPLRQPLPCTLPQMMVPEYERKDYFGNYVVRISPIWSRSLQFRKAKIARNSLPVQHY